MRKHKEKTNGLGLEFLYIFLDYYSALEFKTALFEMMIPAVASLICSINYYHCGLIHKALIKLSDLLPSAISILIGFTAMMVTLLITTDNSNVNKLKETKTEKIIREKPVTLFQKFFIQSCHSLFNEIILLLIVFLYLYFCGFGKMNTILSFAFLFIQTYLVINILISIFNNITSIYYSFYNSKSNSNSINK